MIHDSEIHIAIIGGGASGMLTAIHLCRTLTVKTSLHLIDKQDHIAKGLAYGVDDPVFILNVPAMKMGAFHDQQDDFYHWVNDKPELWRGLHPDLESVEYSPHDFLPRMIYAAYLQDSLERGVAENEQVSLVHHNDYVLSVTPHPSGVQLELKTSDSILCDYAVLATGNSNPRKIAPDFKNVYDAPYDAEFLRRDWGEDDHIAIAGTGLSMIDALAFLAGNGFKGKITAFSKNGLTPLSHREHFDPIDPVLPRSGFSPVQIVRTLRTAFERIQPWQAVIDSLRLISNEIWMNLSHSDQKRLARLLPFWAVARHRIPQPSYERLQNMLSSGQLTMIKARASEISENPDHTLDIRFGNDRHISSVALVHCSGFDYRAQGLDVLFKDCEIETHWNGILKTVSRDSFQISSQCALYALGPVLQGYMFESVAINEIRQQAEALSAEISHNIK